jgi:hypothetical protein
VSGRRSARANYETFLSKARLEAGHGNEPQTRSSDALARYPKSVLLKTLRNDPELSTATGTHFARIMDEVPNKISWTRADRAQPGLSLSEIYLWTTWPDVMGTYSTHVIGAVSRNYGVLGPGRLP